VTALPYMTDAEFDELESVMAEGWATLREWYGNTSLTIARQDGTTGAYTVVSIRLANRQEQQTGTGTPTQGTELTGALRLWTSDVTARSVRIGDRFVWNGQLCVIAAGPIAKRGGISEFAFTLTARNV
jgi:hypothetical protein